MNRKVGPFHVHALVLATVAMLASIWLFGLVSTDADAQGGPDHSDLAHHHGFTGPGNVADWPPRPTGAGGSMQPAEQLPPQAQAAPGIAAQALRAGVVIPPAVAAELGDDWIHISTVEGKGGKDGYIPGEKTYFSRDKNQTVIVLDYPGSQQVLTFAPDELQPVITAGETAEAAELGRQWLLDQGHAGVAELEGFGIRALDDGELAPVRMVYITYATSWFDDPIYSALVDLTNGVVVEGGVL